MRYLSVLSLSGLILGLFGAFGEDLAQQDMYRQLVVSTVTSPTELAGLFVSPLKCDGDANLFFATTVDGVTGIQKVNSKGERIAVFQSSSAPGITVKVAGYFSLSTDGDVYQLVFTDKKPRYIVHFDPRGRYKSAVELKTEFVWTPETFAVFASGEFLVSGERYDTDISAAKVPFTAIFNTDGTLIRELTLSDDQQMREYMAKHDERFASPQNPNSNRAIALGSMEAASNGRVLLMRRTSPAVFYVIAPGGTVERRFTVDPGNHDFMPSSMHLSGSRIAILFRQPQTREQLIEVLDLEGKPIARYHDPKADGQGLGTAFVCYSMNPERFTFLTTLDNSKLGLRIAEPR